MVRADNTKTTISKVDFEVMNHVGVLTIAKHFINRQSKSVLTDSAFTTANQLLKDYIDEFTRIDVELHYLFKIGVIHESPNTSLEGIEDMHFGPTSDFEFGYVLSAKWIVQEEIFEIRQNHMVHTNVLEKNISKTPKSYAPDDVKQEFVQVLRWWIEVQTWLLKPMFLPFKMKNDDDIDKVILWRFFFQISTQIYLM
ncbi:unnamed protein product [Lactuca virosa]|uniref:Uncharacterized protein n=1 Tax=Lactuca virosa TaxID=75947 RepID=A0AAU9NQX9_9ASTR|nr:unnamed protein product [Lactuca virosa]